MINFTLGVIISGTVLLTIYFILFSRRKIFDFRKNDQLARLISQDNFEFLLIDVRTEEEYNDSHIPESINIPYGRLITSLPVENMFLTIIVYGGNRRIPSRAVEYLSENGYFNVTSFGSISRWNGELITNEYIGDKDIENSSKGRFNFPV